MSSVEHGETPAGQPRPRASNALNALRRFVGVRVRGVASEGGAGSQRSTMRLNPFGLFATSTVALEDGDPGSGEVFRVVSFRYCGAEGHERDAGLALTLRQRNELNTTANDVRCAHADGVDNTGNFHWPAEEVLAHMLLSRAFEASLPAVLGSPLASPLGVLEIGAGFGLAGFAAAASGRFSPVIVTDGNSNVVRNLAVNIQRLRSAAPSSPLPVDTVVEAACVRWQDPASYAPFVGRVRLLVGADCLFFETFHSDLITMLLVFLRAAPDTTAVALLAPSRGGSLERFVERFKASGAPFVVRVHRRCDARVTVIHERALAAKQLQQGGPTCVAGGTAVLDDAKWAVDYEPDRHHPLLVTISSKPWVLGD